MAKGASKAAQTLTGVNEANANYYGGQGQDINAQLLPFLQNELNNPQGYGQQTLSEMQTQGGQAVSGATGAAKEAAELNASRTGNPASTAGIIDTAARSAMKQQSNNALSIDQQNALLKQQQQQAGESGLSNLYGQDVNAALKSLGLANESVGEWTGADKANPWENLGPQLTGNWLSPGKG